MLAIARRHSAWVGPNRVVRPGQGTVELALALSLLLLVVLGCLEFALFAQARQVVVSAAQEGARVASAEGRTLDEGQRQAWALLRLGLGARADGLTITPACAAVANDICLADTVAMRVDGAYPLRLLGGAVAVPIEVEVRMFAEHVPSGP